MSSVPYLLALQSFRTIGVVRLAYETYPTRILFFERYIRMLTYSVLAYAYDGVSFGTEMNFTLHYITFFNVA